MLFDQREREKVKEKIYYNLKENRDDGGGPSSKFFALLLVAERGNIVELEPLDEKHGQKKNTCQTVARTHVTMKRKGGDALLSSVYISRRSSSLSSIPTSAGFHLFFLSGLLLQTLYLPSFEFFECL